MSVERKLASGPVQLCRLEEVDEEARVGYDNGKNMSKWMSQSKWATEGTRKCMCVWRSTSV